MGLKGKDFVLKVGDGQVTESFTTIAGFTANTLTINNEAIEITDKGDSYWRTLLDQAGAKSVSISGEGVLDPDVAEQDALIDDSISGAIKNYQIVNEDGDAFEGAFKIVSYEQSGDQADAVRFSITLESAGAVTYTEGA